LIIASSVALSLCAKWVGALQETPRDAPIAATAAGFGTEANLLPNAANASHAARVDRHETRDTRAIVTRVLIPPTRRYRREGAVRARVKRGRRPPTTYAIAFAPAWIFVPRI